jgi:Globin
VKKILPSVKIDCTRRIMPSEICYDTVDTVLQSWEKKILSIPNWSHSTGESFLRHIFRLAPPTITLFGFPADTKYNDPSLSTNIKFITKGVTLIKAIDMAVMFLGPDLEAFEEELYRLGWRHIAMRARPEHWPVVGEALMCTFEDCMRGKFTKKEREAWTIVSSFSCARLNSENN